MFDLLNSSFIDYPGKITAVIFSGGCNFRCPFCHNPGLALGTTAASATPEDLLSLLDARKGLLDGLCWSGGEPLQQEPQGPWIELLQAVKRRGLLVKIDTNGSFPERLANLIKLQLVDYIALDIKTAPAQYPQAAGIKVPVAHILRPIMETIALLKKGLVEYELRTTVVPPFYTPEVARAIAHWLSPAPRYVLQQFNPGRPNQGHLLLNPEYQQLKPYSADQLRALAAVVKPYFDQVLIRGI